VRIAEKIISDLRTTGEDSVQNMLKRLSELKKKEAALEQDVDNLKDILNTKES